MAIEPLQLPEFYFHTFAAHRPAIRVQTGATLRARCPDSDNFDASGALVPADRRDSGPSDGSPPFAGNPLAGPVYVEGAQPGDSISIRIESIDLPRDTGRTLLAPAHGLLGADDLTGGESPVPRRMLAWKLDRANRRAELTNPTGADAIAVPLAPFVGCVGVCPPFGQGIASLFAGDFGGNMDLPFLGPGAGIDLPVFAAGGGVMLGDIHAAQGEGEMIGGGIETAGDVTFAVHRLPGAGLEFPRARDTASIYAIASDGELRTGVRRAAGRMVRWLSQSLDMATFDAYALVSQTGRIVVGNLVTPPYSVAIALSRSVLPARVQERLGRLP